MSTEYILFHMFIGLLLFFIDFMKFGGPIGLGSRNDYIFFVHLQCGCFVSTEVETNRNIMLKCKRFLFSVR